MRYLMMIAVIVAAFGLAWQQSHRPTSVVTQSSESLLQQWPKVTPDEVRAIYIHHGKEEVHLNRRAGKWMVEDRYGEVTADQQLVSRLLNDATVMRPQRVVSTHSRNFARFHLTDDADRLTLKGEEGVVLLDLLVGKAGTDAISTTVRQVKRNTILNVNRSLGWQLGRTAASWRQVQSKKEGRSNG